MGSGGAIGTAPREQAAAELAEETGLTVAPGRLRAHGARQAVASVSAHRHHVFSLELTAAELSRLRADDSVHGESAEERTTVEVHRLGDLLAGDLADWTTLGILAQVLVETT